MLDGNEKQNFYSLMRLRDVVVEGSKPIVLWVGAGTSRWCGYPSWDELAGQLHSIFSRSEANYEKSIGAELVAKGDLPAVLSNCRKANAALYHQLLVSALSPRPTTPVYDHFLHILSSFKPLYVVTTNVDEVLEQHVPSAAIVQRSDFERCASLIQQKQSFVCKLHGSISSVEQAVFTTEDYLKLEKDPAYLSLVKHIFADATVIFIAYGLKDEYVLNALTALEPQSRIFGNGPHFLVTPLAPPVLPSSIIPIKYFVGMQQDHRSASMALDIIRAAQEGKLSRLPTTDVTSSATELTSGYYISDFTPAGTWTSSQTLQLGRPDGTSFFVIVGHGFIDSELPNFHSHSPRDFVVGLLCFEKVYLPLSSLAALHDYVGGEYFWELVKEDVLRFVHVNAQPGYIYDSSESLTSVDVGLIGLSGRDGVLATAQEHIRRQIKAAPGMEAAAEVLLTQLESKVHVFDSESWEVARLVRGALLHPRLRRLLGMSDGIFPMAIPRWLVFPALRVAHTVNTAVVCQQFNLAAANIWFGGEIIVGATFGLAATRDWAHEAASYVMTSQADIDLGATMDVTVLRTILKFRNTSEGVALRQEVLEQLKVNAGSEFISSVNAALKRNIPFTSLDKPRRVFAALLAAESSVPRLTRAISHNQFYSDAAISFWRKRSLQELNAVCEARKIGPYDPCPCGSGEKLKFCCLEALRSAG
ncbi:MAG: SIR2 family protein [Acidobacteriia bacterium]|nr:SIR2 family protein [Terriglobia bacterium]